MAEDRIRSIARLPTLTEVLELGDDEPAIPSRPAALGPAASDDPPTQPPDLAEPTDAEGLASRVLAELELRVGSQLESRLREAMAPALARAVEGLIVDTRHELALALRELVQEAVARALAERGRR